MENESLVLDLLEWIGPSSRAYGDVMDAWRTSCPRLSIWEDALAAGLVEVRTREVSVTPTGHGLLKARRRGVPAGREDGRAR